jgi:hypothetical protein
MNDLITGNGGAEQESKMHTAFVREIAGMSDTFKRQQERLAFILTKAQDTNVETFVRGLEKVTGSVNVWASLESGGMALQISVTMFGLPSMKARRLTRALEYVMAQGFESSGTIDYASIRNRDFKFSKDDLRVRIGAYVTESSKTCLRVQVGEKVVVEPQYEIVCK